MAEIGQENTNTSVKKPSTPAILKCDHCSFTTSWKVNLKRHINSVHLAKSYSCDQCHYTTTRQTTLNMHKKTAHEGWMYKCDYCDFVAGLKQTLKRHIASKHEMKRFKCGYCDFSATRREHLKNHEITSHLGQTFDCDKCEYKTKWRTNLKRHDEIAHGGQEYKCIHCSYSSRYSVNLNYHISRKHTDTLGLKCPFCPYKAFSRQTFAKHLSNAHPTLSLAEFQHHEDPKSPFFDNPDDPNSPDDEDLVVEVDADLDVMEEGKGLGEDYSQLCDMYQDKNGPGIETSLEGQIFILHDVDELNLFNDCRVDVTTSSISSTTTEDLVHQPLSSIEVASNEQVETTLRPIDDSTSP